MKDYNYQVRTIENEGATFTNNLQVAYLQAINLVRTGAQEAYIIDNETGELLKTFKRGY